MTSLRPLKSNLVHELFVYTADENYVTARWCAVNHLYADFCWLAVHALEKYMKAVLLVNGGSAKHFAHDITKLYPEVRKIASPLLPSKLRKSDNLDMHFWWNMSSEEFLGHIYMNGKAENRYMIFGYTVYGHDIYMLDQIVFAIRRLIAPLDEPIVRTRRPTANPISTYREVLSRNAKYRPPTNGPLDKLIKTKEYNAVRFAALNLNYSFAPADFPHRPSTDSISSQSAVIARRVLIPLQSNEVEAVVQALELARWLLDHVYFSKAIAKALECEMEAARARHGLR